VRDQDSDCTEKWVCCFCVACSGPSSFVMLCVVISLGDASLLAQTTAMLLKIGLVSVRSCHAVHMLFRCLGGGGTFRSDPCWHSHLQIARTLVSMHDIIDANRPSLCAGTRRAAGAVPGVCWRLLSAGFTRLPSSRAVYLSCKGSVIFFLYPFSGHQRCWDLAWVEQQQ
jgi:hypothetical protein